MGFLQNLAGTIKDKYNAEKAAREELKEAILIHPSTKAVCTYFHTLFEKGNPGYNWLKENRGYPIYPIVEFDRIRLCYTYTKKNPQSLSEAKGEEITVKEYSYSEINNWYGLSAEDGYTHIDNKFQRGILQTEIRQNIENHPHIKYGGLGYVLKLFG